MGTVYWPNVRARHLTYMGTVYWLNVRARHLRHCDVTGPDTYVIVT